MRWKECGLHREIDRQIDTETDRQTVRERKMPIFSLNHRYTLVGKLTRAKEETITYRSVYMQ